jgi:predicted AlkP superfamily phosphohydrolase/phosphomutase
VRVFVLGIDGLTFQVLDPLIEKGHLPGFARLKKEGAWGILRSTIPPVTPAAWMSIATGLRPAKHGALDFLDVDWQCNGIRLSPITRRKSGRAIWDILSGYNRRVAVVNVPCTYPPDPVNGIMVSGFSTPSQESSFTHPGEFQQELFSLVPDYQIDIKGVEQYEEYSNDELLSLVHKMTDGRIKFLHLLLEHDDWDFVFFTMVGPDRLQHPLWEELISGKSARLISYYRRLDDVVLQVMDWLGDDSLLLVLSDHGFRGANRLCNINQLLSNHGLTVLKPYVRFRNTVVSLLDRLKLKNLIEPIYLAVVSQQPKKARLASERLLSDSKMWALTYAGSVYASLFFSPSVAVIEQEQILAAIVAELRDIGAVGPEEVFAGGTLNSVLGFMNNSVSNSGGPQAILLARPPWAFQGRPRPEGIAQSIRTGGTHDMEGCLLAWGKGVKAGLFTQLASVYDIAPTILYVFDLPIESDFDGHPLTDLFTFQHQIYIHDKTTGAIWGKAQRSDNVLRKIDKLLEETQ